MFVCSSKEMRCWLIKEKLKAPASDILQSKQVSEYLTAASEKYSLAICLHGLLAMKQYLQEASQEDGQVLHKLLLIIRALLISSRNVSSDWQHRD